MWKKPEKPIAIDPAQVTLGLYVWLDMPWDDHPFIYNRFKISDAKQIASLRAIKSKGKLYYYPDKSSAEPEALVEASTAVPPPIDPVQEATINKEIERCNVEKHARLRQQKDAAARADRAWEQAARVTREAMIGMTRSPKQAGAQLAELSKSTASMITQGQEVLLHLLGDKEGEGPQFHALNVMTLAMLCGTGLLPDLTGHVVMVEEVAEHLYAVDRLFFHISQHLRGIAGLRLGRISAVPENDRPFGQTAEEIARHWCARSGIPFLGFADIGHDSANRIVPFGLAGLRGQP